ncbi:hypothetical protein ANME2D_01783 [Candidatus Methanoperedens nitroreducens]|uniref:DUF362 domain-containing protein n=1 Tax=Candidatus Methanoperedens nitratireducens TaxID=1392998 RepID=A0A062V7H4_9EURY|nr:DUF362 domain-containing protein [Candidatus Methanoperedens nitroreducens]KCZ71729.1 hypothetical protein ANME2D_01783 [Candidatus Methanoperedens nitroreducens]MDJ1422298.1 DUF362 domain-containing protein [Candidatus Methanoperedens sp.]
MIDNDKVLIKKMRDSEANIEPNLREALDVLHFEVNDRDNIVIKPNLCDFRPAWEGGTTDPRIVEAFIKIIREKANPKITIVESDHAVATADEEFERMGYKEMAERLGVELVNLSKDKRYEVVLEGHYFETLNTTETLLGATKIISIAKLKTHIQQKITCNMKNLFGLLPEKYKAKYHPFMSEVLVDLAEYYRPFCIIDGIVGMEGPGPSDGYKKEAGMIIVGNNPVATDAVAARIMGFDPERVPNLRYAEKKGLGTTKPEVIGNIAEGKFEFIPVYSYLSYRFALFLNKCSFRVNRYFEGVSKFISLAGGGLMIFARGYYNSSEFGTLFKKDGFRYVRGLIIRLKVLFILRLKT